MPKRSELRITKRTVDALTVDVKDSLFWDLDLVGFGMRVHATGRKVYVVQSQGTEAGYSRAPRRPVHRRVEKAGSRRHRPHQAW